MLARAAIRDVGRAMGVSYAEVDKIAAGSGGIKYYFRRRPKTGAGVG